MLNPSRGNSAHGAYVRSRPGFTLVELVMALVIISVLVVALLPMASRVSRQDSRKVASRNNLRQILEARAAFSDDHAGQMPMRGAQYSFGQMSGWDAWHFGGKNCNIYWQSLSSGLFDESAFSRPLNAYLIGFDIPQPIGYVNTGSGTTWNFHHGTATSQQRASLEIPVFRSPGDRATIQRTWPNPTPGVSCYNDVGTSYLLNMKWSSMPGLPSNFTARFNEGVNRITLAALRPPPNEYVWIHDQNADRVSNAGSTAMIPGEFGGFNRCMVGFIDGRAEYMALVPGAFSGPGYNFWP
jgi:prepilin-type N-terminal cleavage/methylation domain-containing protein